MVSMERMGVRRMRNKDNSCNRKVMAVCDYNEHKSHEYEDAR